jgi:hypothetical protein
MFVNHYKYKQYTKAKIKPVSKFTWYQSIFFRTKNLENIILVLHREFPCLKRLSPLHLHHRPMEHITYQLILPHRFCFSVERLFITVFTAFINAFLLQGGGLRQESHLQNPPPNGCRFAVRWSNARYQGLCFPFAVFVKCIWVIKKKLIF